MAKYLPLPDGSYLELREGETPEQGLRRAQQTYPEAFKAIDVAPERKEGIGAALRGGAERLLSTTQTGIESLFDAEGAARRGVERGEDISRRFAPGADLEAVKKAYQERGLLSAAGEAISQIPGAIAEQAPNIAAALGGARLGAMAGAPLGPIGALVGGVGGAAVPSLAQMFGANLERQAEEGADISRGRALAAAVPGAALETAATFIPLGRSLVGKVLGPRAEEALKAGQREGVERLAKESLPGVLARGAGVGTVAEGLTEVTQQMLERAQAGLDITSDDALAEYGQAAYGAALVGGPFGAAGRAGQRSVARGELQAEALKKQEEEAQKAAEEAAKQKAEEDARKLTPEYRQELEDRFRETAAEINELKSIVKEKGQDPDVVAEAKEKLNQLVPKAQEMAKEIREIQKAAGETPTLEKVLAERQAKKEAEDKAVAKKFDLPLFTGEEATRDLFVTPKGEAQFSLLPDVEQQERVAAEKEELTRLYNEQNQALSDRIEQVSESLAQAQANPAGQGTTIQNLLEEQESLVRLQKQLAESAEEAKVKLVERKVPKQEAIVAAQSKVDRLKNEITKARDLGDFAKENSLQQKLKDAQDQLRSLAREPELFGAENLGRIEREEKAAASIEEGFAALAESRPVTGADNVFNEMLARASTGRQFDKAEQEKLKSKANRLDQIGRYVEKLQESKGLELLGVTQDDRARVERMLEQGSLPPELSEKLFGLPDLSLNNVEQAVNELTQRQTQRAEAFLEDDALILNDKNMLSAEGLAMLRDEIRLRELNKLLERQRRVGAERSKGPRELLTPADFEPIESKIVSLLEAKKVDIDETPPEVQKVAREDLLSRFKDIMYALQRGVFSGDRPSAQDPYEIDRNKRLQDRLDKIRDEATFLRQLLTAAPQDRAAVESRLATLAGRERIVRAGMSTSEIEAESTFDELTKEAKNIRSEFIKRVMAEVNAARVSKGMPAIKPSDPIVTVDTAKGDVQVSLPQFIGDLMTQYITRTGFARTSVVMEEKGRRVRTPATQRKFGDMRAAIDLLEQELEDAITRAKGEKTLLESINEQAPVEKGEPIPAGAGRLRPDSSVIRKLSDELVDLQEKLDAAVPKDVQLAALPVDETGLRRVGWTENQAQAHIDYLTKLRKLFSDAQKSLVPSEFFDEPGPLFNLRDFVELDREFEKAVSADPFLQDLLDKQTSLVEAIQQLDTRIATFKELKSTVKEELAGPAELRQQIEEKKKEIEAQQEKIREDKLKRPAATTDETIREDLKETLQLQLDEIKSMEAQIQKAGVSGTDLAEIIKLDSLKKAAADTAALLKKYLASDDRVKLYAKTEKIGEQIDLLEALVPAQNRNAQFIKKLQDDVKYANATQTELISIDNRLLALEVQPKTDARTKQIKDLKARRNALIKEATKRFEYLKEKTALPDEDVETVARAKAKAKIAVDNFDKRIEDEFVPLRNKEVTLQTELKQLKKQRDKLQDEISIDGDVAKKLEKLNGQIAKTVKDLRDSRKQMFAKRRELETEALELQMRLKELSYPYATTLSKKQADAVVQQELESIDKELGDFNKLLNQLNEDRSKAQEDLAAAKRLSRANTAEERAQGRAAVKDATEEIEALDKRIAEVKDSMASRADVRAKAEKDLREKLKKAGPEGKYGQALVQIKKIIEGELPRLIADYKQVRQAAAAADKRVTSMEVMRREGTDRLAELLYKRMSALRKRVKDSEEKLALALRERKAAIISGTIVTPKGQQLTGVRFETLAEGKKVSEEFEVSQEQLAKLELEIQDLETRLAEDKTLEANASEKLSPQKRKSLEGQLANRKGRYYDLIIQVDPDLITVEVNKLKEREAAETDKQKKNRINKTISKLLSRLRAENEIYKTVRTATLVSGRKPVGVSSSSLSEAMESVYDAVDAALGYVTAEHVQFTPDELGKLEAKRNAVIRDIKKVEGEIDLVSKTTSGSALLKQLRPLKRKLKALQKDRDQINVFRKRAAMTREELNKTLAEINTAEADYDFENAKLTDALGLDDVVDSVEIRNQVIDFRFGDVASTAIDTKAAVKRLEEVKQKAAKQGVVFKYYENISKLPDEVIKQLAAQGLDTLAPRVKGGVMPDGSVFVVVENHSDMTDLEATLAHELVGHYSFESMLGRDGMMKLMRKIDKDFATAKVESGLENLADELGVREQYDAAMDAEYMYHKERLNKGKMTEQEVRNDAKLKGLRELIAYTMEKRVTESFYKKAQRFIKEMVGAFRAALKRLGLMDAGKMTTSDLFYLMKQANDNFTAGKPMAYRNADGSVLFKATAAPAPTGLGKIVATPGKALDGVKANLMGLNFRTQFVDRLAALDALVKKGLSKGVIDSLKAMDVMYFSRMADQRNNFVAEFATNGVGQLTKNAAGERMYTGGKGPSLKDVAEALRGSGVDPRMLENEFTQYLVALRAKRVGLDKLDYSGKVTQQDVDLALARYQNNAAFNKARDLYQQYNNNLIDFLVQTEAIDPARAAKLKDSDYVPYYRERNGGVELVVGTEKPIRIGNFKDQPYLRELKGGEDKVLPVFTGAMQNTSLLVDMALKNMATRNTAWVLRDMGVMEIFSGDGPADANVVRFKMYETKDGKTQMVNKWARIDPTLGDVLFGGIPADLVVQGMEGIKTTVPGLVRMLGIPATWLRRWVTRNPKYAVNQIFRDSMAAVMTTGADFVPVVDTVKQLFNANKNGTLRDLQGKGVVGGQVLTGDFMIDREIIKQMTSGRPGWETAMAKLDKLAMMGDAATRMSMYNSFLKQGLSEREATFATLEAMNFGRRGLSPSVLYANTLIPFFNAQVQGLDVLYRAWTGDMPASQRLRVKQKLQARLLWMATMTMAYAAMMQDDETYENANPDERYGNWFVPTPVGTLRVPIPFELGLIGKAIPEGVYRALMSDDKGSDIASALGTMLFRSVPGDLPTAIKAPVELMLNKSFFTDRPIVDARLEGLDPSEQFRPNTPEIIKLFGAMGLSPVQVEYAIKGFTGTLPVTMLRLLDPVLATSEVSKPELKLEEMPVIGSFFQPKDAGGIINAAYDRVQEYQRASNTYKKMVADGRTEEAEKYLEENKTDVNLASAAGAFRQQMGEITQAERAVRGLTLTPEEKRERLEKLRQLKIQLSKQFTTVSEQIKAQTSP